MPGIFVEYQEPPKEEEVEPIEQKAEEDEKRPTVKAIKHKELLKQFSRISVLDASNYHIEEKKEENTDGRISSHFLIIWPVFARSFLDGNRTNEFDKKSSHISHKLS